MSAKEDRAVLRLYKAVRHYVEANGGTVLVAGGVQIQQWPGDPKSNFFVAVKCTGNLPTFAKAKP